MLSRVRKSDRGWTKRRWARSAFSSSSAGRSRGSWTEMAAAITRTSSRAPSFRACSTMRDTAGEIGMRAMSRPMGVSRRSPSIAPNSSSSW